MVFREYVGFALLVPEESPTRFFGKFVDFDAGEGFGGGILKI
jgi:hypothetical protein